MATTIVIDRKWHQEFEAKLAQLSIFDFEIVNKDDLYTAFAKAIMYEFNEEDYGNAIQLKKDMGYWLQ